MQLIDIKVPQVESETQVISNTVLGYFIPTR